MRFTRRAFASVLIPVAASACNAILDPVVCPLILQTSIEVTVIDSVTGAPPASATLVARSDTFVDSVGPAGPAGLGMTAQGELRLHTLGGPGSYSLIVRSPDYRDWTRTGVEVTKARCGVNVARVTARLQR